MMIMADLYVPMLNESYDFEWNGEMRRGNCQAELRTD